MPKLPEKLQPDAATVRDILKDLGLCGKAFLAWTILVACLFVRADAHVIVGMWWQIVGPWFGFLALWFLVEGVVRVAAHLKSKRAPDNGTPPGDSLIAEIAEDVPDA